MLALIALAVLTVPISASAPPSQYSLTSDDDVYIVVDADYDTGKDPKWTWTGFECVELTQENGGCPANTPLGDPDNNGNLVGCKVKTSPPPGTNPCSGKCFICQGNPNAQGFLCKKSTATPPPTCTGSGVTIDCGNLTNSSCASPAFGGVKPGPNGCGCIAPPSYPAGQVGHPYQCQQG